MVCGNPPTNFAIMGVVSNTINFSVETTTTTNNECTSWTEFKREKKQAYALLKEFPLKEKVFNATLSYSMPMRFGNRAFKKNKDDV